MASSDLPLITAQIPHAYRAERNPSSIKGLRSRRRLTALSATPFQGGGGSGDVPHTLFCRTAEVRLSLQRGAYRCGLVRRNSHQNSHLGIGRSWSARFCGIRLRTTSGLISRWSRVQLSPQPPNLDSARGFCLSEGLKAVGRERPRNALRAMRGPEGTWEGLALKKS